MGCYGPPTVVKGVDPRLLRAWLAMMLWAAVVWGLGSDDLSLQQSSRIIGPILDTLFPGLSWQERQRVIYVIRKSAHPIEYAVLGLLVMRALWLSWRESILLSSVFSAGVVVAMATADEARQGHSAMRTGSGWDVLLDVSGGLAAIAGFLLYRRLRRTSDGERSAPSAKETP